jgi:ATP-binding cassette, subfamily B, bacterial
MAHILTMVKARVLSLVAKFNRVIYRPKDVPVILQMGTVECGAACLAMILAYFGHEVTTEECCERCGPGRDGISALTLAQVARGYGLDVRAFSVESTELAHITLPIIAHWGFNHFVVVERWSPTRIGIVDPSVGRRVVEQSEFNNAFTGIILAFTAGSRFARKRAVKISIWQPFFYKLLQPFRSLLLQILGVSLIVQLFGMVFPFFTQVIVDQIIPNRLVDLMPVLGAVFTIWVVAQIVANFLRSLLLLYLQGQLDTHMMYNFFGHLLKLPFSFFQYRASGDLLIRLASNAAIREVVTGHSVMMILDGFFVLSYLVILLHRDTVFGLFVLGAGIVQSALLWISTPSIKRMTEQSLATQSSAHSFLVEVLMGILTIKTSGAEDRIFDHWSGLYFANLGASMRAHYITIIVNSLMGLIRTLVMFGLLWLGTYRVLQGTMSLGTMLALNALAVAVLTPLYSLVTSLQQFQLVGKHFERLADVLCTRPEQEDPQTQTDPQLTGNIRLEGIDFRYTPNGPLCLEDVSLQIRAGQKLAIVGHSGSGKTTLAKLLLGLFTQTKGQILYDDIPMEAINLKALRSQFGVVMQEPFLFSGTIRENIAFNDPSVRFEQVVQAAQLACVHDEIAIMPMAYETRIAEGGSGLSGGQRQRLVLARALVNRPAILILDEATSHLDSLTEQKIHQSVDQLMATQVIISHRLSTIRNADLILVLERGKIIEQGTHESLIHAGGAYSILFNLQIQN